MKSFKKYFFAAFFLLSLFCKEAFGCACGCGLFNVGTSSLIPNSEGGTAFLQYDYLNQNRNWEKAKSAPAENNEDKKINSQTVTAGMQYMFNRKWGAAIRIPYMARQIKASEIDQNSGAEISKTTRLNSLGDIRINGIYSGFSDNMASGIIFGLKLPTGQNNAKSIAERNMQIGTGSTDSILGFYHRKKIASGNFDYFMQSSWDHPFMTSHNYRPGDEISAATGIYYSAGSVGKIKNVAPILQFTGSKKLRDKGMESDSLNSGYTQVFFAPGIEITVNQFRIYADVEFPIYHYVNGNQLVPRNLYKLILSYGF